MGLWLLWLWVPLGFAEEETLLNTRLETSDLKWTVYPPGEGQWEELSGLDEERQASVRTFEVCSGLGPPGPPQNSWLRSGWVPRRGATHVYAELRFTLLACDSLPRPRHARHARRGDTPADTDTPMDTRRDVLGDTDVLGDAPGDIPRDGPTHWGALGDGPGGEDALSNGPGNRDALSNGPGYRDAAGNGLGNNPGNQDALSNSPGNRDALSNGLGNGPGNRDTHSNGLGDHGALSKGLGNDLGNHDAHSNGPGNHDACSNSLANGPGNHDTYSYSPGNHISPSNGHRNQDVRGNGLGNDPRNRDAPGNGLGNGPGNHISLSDGPGNRDARSDSPGNHDALSDSPGNHDALSNNLGNGPRNRGGPGNGLGNGPGNHISLSNSPGNRDARSAGPSRRRRRPSPPRPCKETFNVFYHEADADTATALTPPWMENPYVKVDTVAAEHLSRRAGGAGGGRPSGRVNRKTLRLGPLSRAGFYLAFQDLGACMALLSVRLYFQRCPEVTTRLARFPATVPRELVAPVAGQCLEGAVPAGAGAPVMYCREDGRWAEPPAQGCVCGPGREPDGGLGCRACPPETFKAEAGGGRCEPCPPLSQAPSPGATSCPCRPGFYRAPGEGPALRCSAPPSAPRSLVARLNGSGVRLEWSTPLDGGGRPDITYAVGCRACPERAPCGPCSRLAFVPAATGLRVPGVTVTGLRPYVTYGFSVSARNGVSHLSPLPAPAQELNVTTTKDVPLPVYDVVRIGGSPTGVTLSWPTPPPAPPGGHVLDYEVKYYEKVGGGEGPPMFLKVPAPRAELGGLRRGGLYGVRVRARSEAGYGDFGPETAVTTQGAGELPPEPPPTPKPLLTTPPGPPNTPAPPNAPPASPGAPQPTPKPPGTPQDPPQTPPNSPPRDPPDPLGPPRDPPNPFGTPVTPPGAPPLPPPIPLGPWGTPVTPLGAPLGPPQPIGTPLGPPQPPLGPSRPLWDPGGPPGLPGPPALTGACRGVAGGARGAGGRGGRPGGAPGAGAAGGDPALLQAPQPPAQGGRGSARPPRREAVHRPPDLRGPRGGPEGLRPGDRRRLRQDRGGHRGRGVRGGVPGPAGAAGAPRVAGGGEDAEGGRGGAAAPGFPGGGRPHGAVRPPQRGAAARGGDGQRPRHDPHRVHGERRPRRLPAGPGGDAGPAAAGGHAAGHRGRHAVPGRDRLRPPRPGRPQHPGGRPAGLQGLRLRAVPRPGGGELGRPHLHQLPGGEDPHPVDGAGGHRLPQVHFGQRRLELRHRHVGGDVLRGATLLGHVQPGRDQRHRAGLPAAAAPPLPHGAAPPDAGLLAARPQRPAPLPRHRQRPRPPHPPPRHPPRHRPRHPPAVPAPAGAARPPRPPRAPLRLGGRVAAHPPAGPIRGDLQQRRRHQPGAAAAAAQRGPAAHGGDAGRPPAADPRQRPEPAEPPQGRPPLLSPPPPAPGPGPAKMAARAPRTRSEGLGPG